MKKLMTAMTLVGGVLGGAAMAQENYIGQIIMGGWNFCPRYTLPTDGQILPIQTNEALYTLLGTQYGGDGQTTFGIPDLRGRFPMHPGAGNGLSPRTQGESGGAETSTPGSAAGTLAVTDAPEKGKSVGVMNPFQVVRFCIVTEGLYPQRD